MLRVEKPKGDTAQEAERKRINNARLPELIGKEIIRIAPCNTRRGLVYSFLEESVILRAINEYHMIINWNGSAGLTGDHILYGAEWIDGNWIEFIPPKGGLKK
ncbi:MAG: hypothetical protein PHX61_02420 [Alphaproteobacteria bacterium]|nr:hypothetical protein [Alphaproteobacteria bacterium]